LAAACLGGRSSCESENKVAGAEVDDVGDKDRHLGAAGAAGVGLDDHVAVLGVDADLTRSGEGVVADELEGLEPALVRLGVDQLKIDPIAVAVVEVGDRVETREEVKAVADLEVAEEIRARAAGQAVGAEAPDETVSARAAVGVAPV
jgi:hypothetical protein